MIEQPTRDKTYCTAEGAYLRLGGKDVADIMIKEGFAVAYNGKGPRRSWCSQ